MEFVYHSQEGQDKFVSNVFFKDKFGGFFVDVGAHDGVSINNTLHFERDKKWTGINFEPIKPVFDKLVESRPNCVNINKAVCETDGVENFVYNTGYTEMISGLSKHYDPRHKNRCQNEIKYYGGNTTEVPIETVRLETVFSNHNVSHVNYLSFDVDGAEFSVIKSINFEKVIIDVIGFENNYHDASVPIINYLISKGYRMSSYKGLDIIMYRLESFPTGSY